MAYISPRSPYPISSVIGDSIDSSGQSIDGNNNHETVVNNDSSYDDRCGEALEKRCMSPEAEIGLIPQYGRSRDWSHDQSSPTISRFPSDERGRGRSRERLVSRKKFDSPDMQTSRQVMVGASKQGKEIGHKEGEGQGVKDTARVITRRRPSPKRLAAPCPPSPRSCPSPAPKPVSTSDVRPADVEGWLLDQLRGRPVWCVLSDLLFCVFERPDAETSKQVLVLPGCTVRVLEFKSAHLHLDKRRLLHGARLDSTASSSSAASYCTVINGKDDNNNKHSKDLSMCNGNVVATDDEVKSKGSGNGFSPKPLDGPSSSNAGSISSTSSYQSVTDGRTRGGSTGSVGSSSSSSSNIPNTLGLGNSKTVSGVDRFQFVLENSVTRQKHMFAVASRVELDLWTNALYKACSLDIASKVSGISNQSVHQEEQGKNCTHSKGRSVGVEDIILSDRSETSPLNGIATNGTSPRWKVKPVEDSISPTYTPRQTLPSRIDVHSLSLSLTSPHDVSKETVDEIRRKLKKDNQHVDGVELKPTPLKATHQLDESNAESTVVDASKIKSTATSNNGEAPRKGRQFFKGRSPLDVLLGRKKRSSSADDAYNRNRKLFPVYKRSEDSLSNPSSSPCQAGSTSSQQSLESSQSSHSQHGQHTHDSSFSNSSVDSRDSPRKKQSVSRSSKHRGGGPLARSWDPDMKTSRGFGASIRRTASDLKERVFGGSNTLLSSTKTSENPNSGSKPPGLKFKDLTDARVKGYLQYRVAFKFVKVFCVLSKGCFYAFKSGKHEEVPLLAMVLSPCTVTYVVESELVLHRKKSKQKQRIFAFKLSQPHCKSIYACADDHQTLMQWVMAIQGEACRVQVDEELAAEIREKPSSLKKKQEKGLSGQASLQEHNLEPSSLSKKHQVNQLEHRLSCPSFDGAELGLDKSSQALSSRAETLNGLITPRRGAGLSSINPQQAQSRGKGERSRESASIALHRSKSDKDIDLIFQSIKTNKEKSKKDEDCDKVVNDKSSQCKTDGGIGSENKTSFRPSRDVRDIISAYQTHHSPYSVYQLNKKVDNSSNRTEIDPSSIDNIRHPTQHHLRLDLSGLADDNDILDMDTSSTDVANSSQGAPQSYSYRGEDNYHTGPAEETFRSATSPEKFPWKPNVKRTSSLNNTPATSVTRSSLSRSSLLPSKSGVSAGIDGKSSSPPTSHKKQTQSSKLTSFFSTSDFDAEQGYSSYSNFPGLKETRNQESRYTINRALGFDSEDFNPGGDIISPPPLFRCSEPGSTNLTLTQTPQDQQAAPGGTSSPQVPPQPIPEGERPRHLPFPLATQPAVREAWSRDEDYLLGVLRDRLRRRRTSRQREPDLGGEDGLGPVIIQNGPGSEYTMASVVPRPMNHPTDLSDVMDRQKPTFDRDEMTGVADVTQQAMELEGFLEMRDGTGKWTRVQCRLKESSLVVNCIESETHPTPDVIDLTGCEVTELIDQFQGKRFVLRLEHQTAPPVLISLDSREDLALWKQNILASLNRARRVHAEPMPITSTAQWRSAGKVAPPIEELHPQTSTSSAQSIKQKLLAEMLRQREELERMQTARAEMKAGQPQHPDALVLDEERIVALTRLRQRRMSTQIKLQAIQRQIESVHCLSPREKKSTFLPLGRKRAPDLLLQTQHAKEGEELVQQDSRAALEAQVKSLSSQLHDLDENISSHEGSGLASPRDEASSQVFLRKHSPVYGQEILRHSLDPSCLFSSRDASIRDSVVLEDDHEDEMNVGRHLAGYDLGEDGPAGGALRTSGVAAKKESRGKETASSTSRSASGFKSSVQKLAHRTFSRATNWNWATKKTSSFSSTASAVSSPCAAKDGVHSDNNNTIASLKQDRLYGEISTSFTTPDVIDMTTRGNDKLAMSSIRPEHRQRVSRDDSDIRTIPGSLDGDSVDGKSQDIAHKVHRTPKERILSKMVQSSSLSGINQFDARLQNFSSSSPDLASDGSHPHLHPASGPQDIEYREHSGLRSSNMPQQTWRPSSLTLTASTSHGYRASPTATPPGGAANFSPSPRGSEDKVMTPRREVNPDALAQIEAFEELSLRYLGAAAK